MELSRGAVAVWCEGAGRRGFCFTLLFGADRSSSHWMMSCRACQRLSPSGAGTGAGQRSITSRFLTRDPAGMNHGVSVVPAGSLPYPHSRSLRTSRVVSGPSGASSHRTSSSPFQNASCISTSKAVDGDGASGLTRSYVKPGRTSARRYWLTVNEFHIISSFT